MAKKSKKRKKVVSRTGRQTKAGFVSAEFEAPDIPDYVVVELRYESPVAFSTSRFGAPAAAAAQADALNNVLAKYDIRTLRSQFGLPLSAVKSRIEVAATLPKEPEPKKFAKKGMDTEFIESGFVQVVPKKGGDARKIARELNRKGPVWKAYVAPRPVPAAVVERIAGWQPELRTFTGLPALAAERHRRDGGVAVGWSEGRGNHDLRHRRQLESEARGPAVRHPAHRRYGHRRPRLEESRHGGSRRDDLHPGCQGNGRHQPRGEGDRPLRGDQRRVQRGRRDRESDGGLKAGDVILIELQATGPNGKYVAMQFWPDIFTAIAAATAKGITVVEAAGNGNENFDLAIFNGTGLQKDSGAIVVGAGIPPTNHFDIDNAMRRSACLDRGSGSPTTGGS